MNTIYYDITILPTAYQRYIKLPAFTKPSIASPPLQLYSESHVTTRKPLPQLLRLVDNDNRLLFFIRILFFFFNLFFRNFLFCFSGQLVRFIVWESLKFDLIYKKNKKYLDLFPPSLLSFTIQREERLFQNNGFFVDCKRNCTTSSRAIV